MKKAVTKNELDKAVSILLGCNKKATTLKALNDFLENEGSFQDEAEAAVVFGGQSQILFEIIEQISDVIEIVDVASDSFPAKEVLA
jgi:hypothetical protein